MRLNQPVKISRPLTRDNITLHQGLAGVVSAMEPEGTFTVSFPFVEIVFSLEEDADEIERCLTFQGRA